MDSRKIIVGEHWWAACLGFLAIPAHREINWRSSNAGSASNGGV